MQWQQKNRAENLTCYGTRDCTNNRCEYFHSDLKNLVKVHKPIFGAFIFNFICFLHHFYLSYLSLLQHGLDNFSRGRMKSTKRSLIIEKKAEENLAKGV